jgi:tetratricopeptide (TPR) repeat protein
MQMQKGVCLRLAGEKLKSVRALRQAVAQLDGCRDPQLAAVARQNLLDALVDAGKFREAGRFLLESGLGLAFAEDPLNLRRLRWVEAKILAGRGRLDLAERVFEEVREGFRQQDLGYIAALVGLDLAVVLLKQGKDIRYLAEELSKECRSHGINPEAVKAFKSFEILCRHKGATVPRVEKLRDFLIQLQDFPRLRFEPELVFG